MSIEGMKMNEVLMYVLYYVHKKYLVCCTMYMVQIQVFYRLLG